MRLVHRRSGAWEGISDRYARHLRDRRQMILICRRSLSMRTGVRALAEAYHALDVWQTRRQSGPAPELLIVAQTARRFVASLGVPEVEPGMTVYEPSGLLRIVVIELARVPQEDGAWGLHLMSVPPDGTRDVVAAFLADESVPASVRDALRASIRRGTFPANDAELGLVGNLAGESGAVPLA